MNQPDFERAKEYALKRLEKELPPDLLYHNLEHTRDIVVPAVERLAAMEGIEGEALLLLRTAAYYHDLGFVEHREQHEETSVRIASKVLPQWGYSPDQLDVIERIILATRVPQRPNSLLERVMADADLDVLGGEKFWEINRALRAELAAFGETMTDEQWYQIQLDFMRQHQYFTEAARKSRGVKKNQYISEMESMLEDCKAATAMSLDTNETSELTAADRVALLRSVSIFSETPDDILNEVAGLLYPIEFVEGDTVIEKGDCGDCMYIIESGRVRVHDGEMTLNWLGVADVFGEMALLEEEPRVASVTATEGTRLLRLDQGPFYALMASRAEVASGIIRVLSRHLRARVRDMAQDFEYMQQMARITAAAVALEAGVYDPRSLDQVGQRTDELGQLARVFQRMANEVVAREQRLKQELQKLRIQIDEVKKEKEVAEIAESDYFKQLRKKVKHLRQDNKDKD